MSDADRERVLARFWSKVHKTGGCWLWPCLETSGYGVFRDGERRVRAHRFSWEAAFGPIPEGLVICHRCDRKRCVNPSHLFIGTQADNIRDAMSKGRMYLGGPFKKSDPRSSRRIPYVRPAWATNRPSSGAAAG